MRPDNNEMQLANGATAQAGCRSQLISVFYGPGVAVFRVELARWRICEASGRARQRGRRSVDR